MSVFDVILGLRSIRSYQDKDIPEGVLNQILESGKQAPSDVNRQP